MFLCQWETRDGTVAVVYIYNKMLPLSLGEFMRPFLLTFTLIFVIHKHELLNLILLRIQLNTPFDICPSCDDIRQQTSHCNVRSKNTQPTVALIIIFCSQTYTHFLHLKCLFLTILKFSLSSLCTNIIQILYRFIPIVYTLEIECYLKPTHYFK